jgi:hypothetical protein
MGGKITYHIYYVRVLIYPRCQKAPKEWNGFKDK